MRLDKFLTTQTDFSRSVAKKVIHSGQVTINGEIEKNTGAKISAADSVCLNGRELSQQQLHYYMLNKPVGYICSTDDGHHPLALDLMADVYARNLHFAGRLDLDTTGLVLLSNDGQWTHRVTHPNHECKKRYRVTTVDPISDSTVQLFAEGVMLNGEKKPTKPATLVLIDSHNALLTIHEGKYHQVKRMFAAVANRVCKLHREAIGDIELDPTLAAGEYRPLTPSEIEGF